MDEPRRSMGGWIPPKQGVQPADLYAKWLNGREDSPVRRAEFTAETGVTLPEEE